MKLRVAAAVLALACGTAAAEAIALPNTKARLVLPDGWKAVEAAGIVAAHRSPKGTVVAVTRAQLANPDAWMGAKQREAYTTQIERGILRTLTATSRKLTEVNGVHALDVEARRADGALVFVRVLMFRTYSLALAIEVPKDRDGDGANEARKIIAAFQSAA